LNQVPALTGERWDQNDDEQSDQPKQDNGRQEHRSPMRPMMFVCAIHERRESNGDKQGQKQQFYQRP